MKKALFAMAVFALVVAACGGSGDGDAVATTLAPTTTTTTTTTTTVPPTTMTEAPTTTTTEASSFVPSGDPDKDAVATAYIVAFDSTTDFDAKVPYVEDLTGLEETVVKYMEQGETMGGVTIVVTSVEVDGDSGDILYDLMFNNRLIYPDLPGTAMLTDTGWVVPRTEFCGMMSSARVPCPTE